MPFGLSVASEIFSEDMDKTLAGIPGTFPCADDVKVQGSTEERHDIHLLETVEKAHKAGIKFNPDKCRIKKEKIRVFWQSGFSPRRGTMSEEGEGRHEAATPSKQARTAKFPWNSELHVQLHPKSV